MAYCVPARIPHSILKGRVPDPGESDWTPADLDKALLWQGYEARRCPQCGTHPDEWPADTREEQEPPPYLAEPYRCHGCRDIGETRETLPHGPGTDGIYVRLRRVVGGWEEVDEFEDQRERMRFTRVTGKRPEDEEGMLA